MFTFDLVDEMQWEDLVEWETLEAAGLENDDRDTVFGSSQLAYYLEEGDH